MTLFPFDALCAVMIVPPPVPRACAHPTLLSPWPSTVQEKNAKFQTNPEATFGGITRYLGGLSSLIGETKAGDPLVRRPSVSQQKKRAGVSLSPPCGFSQMNW